MTKSKILWAFFVTLFIGFVIPMSLEAQTKTLPAKIHFAGTVNYDFGYDQARTVKCYLDLKIGKGQVSGTTNYATEYDGSLCEVTGTVKANSDGSYDIDVYIQDNSGCEFEGVYNPKTGIFSGKFSGRGLSKSYPFKFTHSK